jgi:hypothetical protein
MKTFKVFAAIAAIVLFSHPRVARAQCNVTINSCMPEGHTANTGSGSFGVGLGLHGACALCLDGTTEQPAYVCHQCESLALSSEQQVAYRQLKRAGAVGDIDEVLRWGSKLPGKVLLNRSRNSLQIRDCNGTSVIASIPIATQAQLIAAQSLNSTNSESRARVVGLH